MKNYVSPLRGVQEVEERENSFKGGMKAWKNIESNGPVAGLVPRVLFFCEKLSFWETSVK